MSKRIIRPKAVLGIRPCDAAAFLLVKRNFDTPEYQDPYWMKSYEATTFVGFACNNPCTTCFCTTAGCGPFHEDGLDVLLVDDGEWYGKSTDGKRQGCWRPPDGKSRLMMPEK